MSSKKVLYSVDGNIATITLNKPEDENALSYEMYRKILEAFETAKHDGVRCVEIEGAGSTFSIGYGIDALEEEDVDHSMGAGDYIEQIQETGHALIKEVLEYPIPTIAKVDGPAFGDAACLAIGCDITMANENARIGFTQIQVGLSVDMAATYLLPQIIGTKSAKQLAFTGEIIGPERAAELGLVNEVYSNDRFDACCEDLTSMIASKPPIALQQINYLINQGSENSLENTLRSEATTQTMLLETDDFQEAVSALKDKREPNYTGQ